MHLDTATGQCEEQMTTSTFAHSEMLSTTRLFHGRMLGSAATFHEGTCWGHVATFLEDGTALLETIHKRVSVKAFSETAVTLLHHYQVEDEATLHTAATGLVASIPVNPDIVRVNMADNYVIPGLAEDQDSGLCPYQQLFTCPSLLSSSSSPWSPRLQPLLALLDNLEEAALAALQAMLLASTMFLTGHKPTGLTLKVVRAWAVPGQPAIPCQSTWPDKSLDREHVRRRINFILALSGEINKRTSGSKNGVQLCKMHKDILDMVARS